MGFRENLMVNFDDKIIEYDGVKFQVLKTFDYEGKHYIYAFDPKSANTKQIEVMFFYKNSSGKFNYVDNDELFNELLSYACGLLTADLIKKTENEVLNKKNK